MMPVLAVTTLISFTQGWIKLDCQSFKLAHIQLVEETFCFE